MVPAKWMQHVSQNGPPDDICAEELEDGNDRCSLGDRRLYPYLQVSRRRRGEASSWSRGCGACGLGAARRGRLSADSPHVVVFDQLQQLLQRKVVTVFGVAGCQLLHLEIDQQTTTMRDVQAFVKLSTGLEPTRQDLRLPRGDRPGTSPAQSALQCWAPPQEETEWVLYVFDAAGAEGGGSADIQLPPLVLEMLKDTEHRPAYYRQVRSRTRNTGHRQVRSRTRNTGPPTTDRSGQGHGTLAHPPPTGQVRDTEHIGPPATD
ncbi:uncharacterized protein LOC119095403, partial [Pollicipes pollicipes]|uniref:uncharacterized protein LOC119095403 n=1 Tax=Pollicipes pollicipes TaxID=41117 RepID=UPI001884CD81